MAKQSIVALIPARGGSKRLPAKNIRPLAGKPLIAYTIEAALASTGISSVIVSTDDTKIAETAKTWGAEVPFKRPHEISGDEARTEDVALHLLEFLKERGREVDILAVLQPTSPLRGARHIDEALEHFSRSAAASLVSVTPLGIPRDVLRWVEGGMATKPAGPAGEAYRLNGAIYIVRSEQLLRSGSLSPEPCAAYVMDPDVSVDIDTRADWEEAEKMLVEVGKA